MTHIAPALPRTPRWQGDLARAMAGTWLHAGARLILYVTISKVAGLEQLGAWALGVAIAEPVFKLANLGLRPVHATDAQGHLGFDRILAIRAVTVVLALGLCVGGTLLAPQTLFATLTLTAIVGRAAESLSDIALGEFQRAQVFAYVAASGAARLFVTLGAAMAIHAGVPLDLALPALVGTMAALGLLEIAVARGLDRPTLRATPVPLRLVLQSAAHLGLTAFVIAYLTQVNRFAAAWFGSMTDVGVLAVAAILVAFGQTFVRGIALWGLPILSGSSAAAGLARDRVTALQSMAIGVTMCIGLGIALWGGPVLALAFSDEAGTYAPLIGAIFAVSGLRYAASLQNVRLMATRAFAVQTPFAITIFALGSAVSFASVAAFGLWGAVLANVIIWGGVLTLRTRLLRQVEAQT